MFVRSFHSSHRECVIRSCYQQQKKRISVLSVSAILLAPQTQRGTQHNTTQRNTAHHNVPIKDPFLPQLIQCDAMRFDRLRCDTIHGITINQRQYSTVLYKMREKNNICSSFFDSFSSLLEEIIKSICAKAKQSVYKQTNI